MGVERVEGGYRSVKEFFSFVRILGGLFFGGVKVFYLVVNFG